MKIYDAVKLEHRTEKCAAVFGQSDAQIKEIERRTDSIKASSALDEKPGARPGFLV